MNIEILYDLFSVASLAHRVCLAFRRPLRNSHWMNKCTNGSPAPLGQSIPALCSLGECCEELKDPLSFMSITFGRGWGTRYHSDVSPRVWFGKKIRLLTSRNIEVQGVWSSSEVTLWSLILHCRVPMPTRRHGCSEPMCRMQSITEVKTQALEIGRLML